MHIRFPGKIESERKAFIIADDYRIEYTKAHIEAMQEAMRDGVDLMGYLSWGIIDLVGSPTGHKSHTALQIRKQYGFYTRELNDLPTDYGYFQSRSKLFGK